MIRRSQKIKQMINWTSGVSEVIGAILLVSLVVLAVAVIAVGLLSQPLPKEVPNVHFIAGTNGNKLYLYHDGGDSLYKGQFYLIINGKPKMVYDIVEGGEDWSVGKNLVVDLTTPTGEIVPETVQIVYDTGSSQVVLDQAQLRPVVSSTMVPDVIVTPIPPCPCNISSCGQAVIGDAYDNIVTESASIFIRDGSESNLDPNGFLQFQVTNTSSSIMVDGNNIPLSVNDRVLIYLRQNTQSFKIFGLGNKFYQLRGKGVNVQIIYSVNGTINNFENKPVTVDNAWITGYIDLGSTFTLRSTPNNKQPYTLLALNNITPYPYYNGNNGVPIIISNIRPIGVGLFSLDYDSQSQTGISFIGTYGSISYT